MRQAKKLGLLGLSIIALVVAFGILVGGKRPQPVAAQTVTVGTCVSLAQCSFTTTTAVTGTATVGGTFTISSTVPITSAIVEYGTVSCIPTGIGTTLVTVTCPPGVTLPAGVPVTLGFSGTTSPTVTVSYPSTSSVLGGVCFPSPVQTANQVVTCTNGQFPATVGGSYVFQVTVTASAGTVLVNGNPSLTGAASGSCAWETATSYPTPVFNGTLSCGFTTFTSFVNEGLITMTFIASTPGATITECTTFLPTASTPAYLTAYGCSNTQTVTFGVGTSGTPFTAPLDPTGEVKYCSNVEGTNNTGLPAFTSGTTAQIEGPSNSFTIPEFNPSTPTTCLLVPTRNGVPCNVASGVTLATTVTSNPCADGYFVLNMETPNSVITIGCQNNLNAFNFTVPGSGFTGGTIATVGPFQGLPPGYVVSGGAGPCESLTSGTSLIIPCGVTATNTNTGQFSPPNYSTANGSATCTGVLFTVQSNMNACASEPTLSVSPGGCGYGTNYLNGPGTGTVDVQWLETPGLPNELGGGLKLGTNSFTVAPPPLGALLVSATPEAIPSNGTLASVVTATFACGNEYGVTSTGFPLSSIGTSATTVNQPILGTQNLINGLGQSAVCGAGLPGTFTFASPGPVLFDNGRSEESVSCGLSAQDNIFGVGQFGNFSNGIPGLGGPLANPTFPLVFTCTGAAVLAIGAGAAGDAPINVTYQSAVGGLNAVGSTLIVVSPSGVPRISIACSPSVIAAGNTGSVCTATVTDQNGVPLTGITGATVTFTVSDPTEATILPCVVAVPGAINVTTSPNVIPQIVPTTPCNPPSGTIPGQVNTFVNGQATALLVASSYARPEVVTVSASLGVLIPPEFACLVSPYTPVGFGALPVSNVAGAVNLNPIVSGVGLPGLTGCGTSNPVGFTGLASALSADSGGLTGIVTLPNTTSASTTVQIGGPAGILIAGATTTQPLGLLRGCNQIIVTTTAGTPIANIAALVSPASAVVSIWTFNNGTKQFRLAFSSDPAAPVDITVTGQTAATQQGSTTVAGTGGLAINSIPAAGAQVTEVYFVCVNQSATIVSG